MLAAAAVAERLGADAAPAQLRVVALAPPTGLRQPATVSEPHIALDPKRPGVLLAVAQTIDLVAWRSTDGGATWTGGRPVAGTGRRGYAAGDPVVAVRSDGSALLAGVSFDVHGKCTFRNYVGTYRSPAGRPNFGAFAAAGLPTLLPRHFFGQPPVPKLPRAAAPDAADDQ